MSDALQRELAEVKEEIKQVKSTIKQLEQLPKGEPERLQLVALLVELLKKENRLAEGVAGAAGAAGAAALRHISESDRAFVCVAIDGHTHQLEAELLVDTGYTQELLLSEYTLQKLGLHFDGDVRSASIANGAQVLLRRYGVVKVFVLEVAPDGSQRKGTSAWLECYALPDTGPKDALVSIGTPPFPPGLVLTAGGVSGACAAGHSAGEASGIGSASGCGSGSGRASSSGSGSGSGNGSGVAVGTPENTSQHFKLKVSPIKRGQDKHKHDALLGRPGMTKLRIGIDKHTGQLCNIQGVVDHVLAGLPCE